MAWKQHLIKNLVLALLASGLSLSAYADCNLTSGWEPWEPYQFAQNGQATGLDNDLVRAILEKAGCQVKFVERPWARILKEVEDGATHIAPGASISEERQQYANFSHPYRDETMVLLVRKGEAGKYPINNIKDIAGMDFKLGVVRDYFYGDDFKAAMENPAFDSKTQKVPSDTANLKKLVSGRVDGILIDKYTGPYLARQEGIFDKIEMHPVAVNSNDIFLMFSKKSVDAATVEKINVALEQLKADGSYNAILDKYLK